MKITNTSNIPLSLAVWLLADDYDYNNDPTYISATSLMKPLKQIVLGSRVEQDDKITPDLDDFIARSLGNSVHDSVEKAWLQGPTKALTALGYPSNVIDRIKVNPPPEELTDDTIAVYIEQRAIKEIAGWKLGGKFDFVAEGIVQDIKTTSAYAWVFGTRDDDFALQGSLYRWLNPDKITEDFIRINFVFTDWQRAQAAYKEDYPNSRIMSKDIPLMSYQDTEKWILTKLKQIDKYKNEPEKNVPECTDEDLWRSEAKYKYYSDPNKTSGRSTRNFKSLAEANKYKVDKGKGTVITIPGEVKRCLYCKAFPICEQRKRYFDD